MRKQTRLIAAFVQTVVVQKVICVHQEILIGFLKLSQPKQRLVILALLRGALAVVE